MISVRAASSLEGVKIMKKFIKSAIKRMGGFDLLVDIGVEVLAESVKNPDSNRARDLRKGVTRLRNACTDFLAQVPAPKQ